MYSVEAKLGTPYKDNLYSLMSTEEYRQMVGKDLWKRMDYIRQCGNRVAHSGKKLGRDEAMLCLEPDSAIFIPYETGVKYITGNSISPTVTVIADDVTEVDRVMGEVERELKESYPNTAFTISDAGSKMDAAAASNETLTLLLVSMAVIVFAVGGIGIMNVLFVTVKERTNEIGTPPRYDVS